MSIGSYHLRSQAFYDLAVEFQMARFRNLLRQEREARVGGRERLAERAGVHKTTIQNIETGTDMPGIDTVAKLVEAMPDFSLSAFFLQLENSSSKAVQLNSPVTPKPKDKDPSIPRGSDESDSLRAEVAQLRAALVSAGSTLFAAGAGSRRVPAASGAPRKTRRRS